MKKNVTLILLFALVSLTFCTPQQEDKKLEAKWKEIICPECKGTGKVKMSTATKIAFGILTLGCGFMCETTECDMCNGSGIVMQRIINDTIK